ncbi:MAG: hypothetical protein JEZ08_13460 [Clostridiales bacterium]|nr:hypothetical protein [Clostridiales bacterium]
MNNLYHSIYSRYYEILLYVLRLSHKTPISVQDIREIIQKKGFQETEYELLDKLISKGKDNYGLLNDSELGYIPILKKTPKRMVSLQEYEWLKVALGDERIKLFLSDELFHKLQMILQDIKPLYDESNLKTVDTFATVGMPADLEVREHIKNVLFAIQNKKALRIHYESKKGNRLNSDFLPLDMRYSLKANKFQVELIGLKNHKNKRFVLDIEGILTSKVIEYNESVAVKKIGFIKEFVEIEISNIRNGFERCFFQLSMYERESRFDEETGKCFMKLFYDKNFETEILITLMSFGPAIKVIGPERFKEIFVKRLINQYNTDGFLNASEAEQKQTSI